MGFWGFGGACMPQASATALARRTARERPGLPGAAAAGGRAVMDALTEIHWRLTWTDREKRASVQLCGVR